MDTVESVIHQDYENIEYVVIDGQSTDGTLSILQNYSEYIDILVSEQDHGIYDAMNKGIKLSTGDIVAVLNSDDTYVCPTIVRQMVELMEERDLDAAYGDSVIVDGHHPEKINRYWRSGWYEKGAFYYGWVPPHPTFFCRKYIYQKFGYFSEKFQIAADFELMFRFIEKHQIKVGYLPKVVTRVRAGGKSNVLKGIVKGNWEIIKSFRLNGLNISPWFFVRKPIDKISQFFKKPRLVE